MNFRNESNSIFGDFSGLIVLTASCFSVNRTWQVHATFFLERGTFSDRRETLCVFVYKRMPNGLGAHKDQIGAKANYKMTNES